MTSHTSDDGFHEIQLDGKQLVFLFMAATVVSVVIFLCGVLVGRGVRSERAGQGESVALDVPVVDQTTATAGDTPAGSDPRVAPPPAAVDDLSYFNRLEKAPPISEELRAPSAPKAASTVAKETPGPAPVRTMASATPPASTVVPPVSTPAPAPAAPPAPPTTAAAATPAPAASSKGAFVVQVAALNSRGEAAAMAKKLSAQGYEAYVQEPAQGAPSIFRVRVGSYSTRRDAESVAARIEKEGQFKPWVAPR